MKKTKILLTGFTTALIALSATSCNNKLSKLDSLNIEKITDYLYSAKIDYDYDFSYAKQYYEKYMPKLGACSSVSVGNIRGRNYDWEYSNGTEFIVRTSKIEGENARHASIGITSLTSLFNDVANNGEYHEQYNLLPFSTLDGINDAGIYVNVNVVPFQSLGKWEMKTKDTSDDLNELASVRLILDKCSYLTDIVDVMDAYDWFSISNMEETHLMVTGPRSKADPTVTTVVFEHVPFTENGKTYRKLCCISNNESDKVLVKNDTSRFYKTNVKNIIMTNFNLWNYDPTLPTREERLNTAINQPMGYERYETIEDMVKDKTEMNMNDMQDVMKRVFFSNAYNIYQKNFWYSDFSMTTTEMKTLTEEQRNPYGDFDKLYSLNKSVKDDIVASINTWAIRDRTKTKEQDLWETVHTSIFNYQTSSFRVIPHEGNIYYEFTL